MVIKKDQIIGIDTTVSIAGQTNIPAKVDTGADSSAIWVSDLHVSKDGVLSFKLFGPSSPYYTGDTIKRIDYQAIKVKSSNGISEIRYRTGISIILKGRRIKVLFTLTDRQKNHFPVLIGHRTLKNRFFVDTSMSEAPKNRSRHRKNNRLTTELQKNPYRFHKKYINNQERSSK